MIGDDGLPHGEEEGYEATPEETEGEKRLRPNRLWLEFVQLEATTIRWA